MTYHSCTLWQAMAREWEFLLLWWNGHPVCVDKTQFHDSSIIWTQVLCQVKLHAGVIFQP